MKQQRFDLFLGEANDPQQPRIRVGENEIFDKTASKPQVQLQRECRESLIIKAKVKHGRGRQCFFLLHVFVDAFKALLNHVETAQEVQAIISVLEILSG